jgi:hypothetical protein
MKDVMGFASLNPSYALDAFVPGGGVRGAVANVRRRKKWLSQFIAEQAVAAEQTG